MQLIKGITPQQIHYRQMAKLLLAFVYYPLSVVAILAIGPSSSMLSAIILWGVLTPVALYYLFKMMQRKATLRIIPESSDSQDDAVKINRIQALTLKRAVYRSRKVLSFEKGKPLFMSIDMLTITSDVADKNVGVVNVLTDEESVAFARALLPDNTTLFVEYYSQFPAPQTILLERKEFEEVCRTLSDATGIRIHYPSGGNL